MHGKYLEYRMIAKWSHLDQSWISLLILANFTKKEFILMQNPTSEPEVNFIEFKNYFTSIIIILKHY